MGEIEFLLSEAVRIRIHFPNPSVEKNSPNLSRVLTVSVC
jgi:hypothetical protein